MSQSIIDVQKLTATYGPVTALNGVNLTVNKGEIFGLLGPNGAGKSTLLACVEGLHKPKNGSVHVSGVDVQADSASTKSQLGIQLQKTALLDDLTVAELVEVYAALYEVYLNSEQIDALLTRFDLLEKRNTLSRRLSGGQQQRLALAVAIANDPQIVLLDEPTSFLDLKHQIKVYDLLKSIQTEKGTTIVAITHDINLASQYCNETLLLYPPGGSTGASPSYRIGKTSEVLTPDEVERAFDVRVFSAIVGGLRFLVPSGARADSPNLPGRTS